MKEILEGLESWYNDLKSCEKAFEEVRLPFEHVDNDYLTGREIRDALTSEEVQKSLESYNIYSFSGDSQFQVKAENYRNSFAVQPSSSINFEGLEPGEYSHLRLEVTSEDEKGLKTVYNDLRRLENGLNDYFKAKNDSSVIEDSPMRYAAD